MTIDLLDKFDDILGEDNLTDSIKRMLLNKDENNSSNLSNLISNLNEYNFLT
jgi:uncharacterized protein YutD